MVMFSFSRLLLNGAKALFTEETSSCLFFPSARSVVSKPYLDNASNTQKTLRHTAPFTTFGRARYYSLWFSSSYRPLEDKLLIPTY